MEKSAWVYITLVAVTVAFAMCVQNREYTAGRLNGIVPAGHIPGSNRQQARNMIAEAAVFCLLAGVSACRIAVGGDYWVYWQNFHLIDQGRYVSYEPGFQLLVRILHWIFGKGTYLPIFGLFSIVTVFLFLKALHDQASWYALSLYLLLTGGYYFNSMNSIRYYFALALALYAMKFVLRGEYGKFLLWILLGSTIHKSILLVIPVYLVAKFLASVRLKKWHYFLGVALVLSLIFGQEFYRKIIFHFYPYYENSIFDNGQLSYANIGKCLGTLALSLICYSRSLKENVVNRFYFFLNVAGMLVYCCGSFIPEVSRVGYYLIISQVLLLPRLLQDMKKGWLRNLCVTGVIGAFLVYFVLLLRSMYDVEVRLLPYLNWIFN